MAKGRPKRKGKGFLDPVIKRVKALVSFSTGMPDRVRRIMDSIRGIPIAYISVGRTPVQSFVQKALNFLSFGRYEQVKHNLRYDDVYHNYLIIYLVNGQIYRFEHNHVVELKLTKERGQFPVSRPPPALTLPNMVQNALRYQPNLFVYHPQTNNCQQFVRTLLAANGMYPIGQAAAEAINGQDAGQLIQSLGNQSGIPSTLTGIARWGDRVIHGGKIPNKRKARRNFISPKKTQRVYI